MSKRTTCALAAILLLAGIVMAAEWWEKKPYTQWSDKEVKRMLDNSPWGKIHTVTIVNPTVTGQRSFESIGTGDLEREKRNLFHMRFLTSKPIRMALARQAMLASEGQMDMAGVQRFVESTDDQSLIIAMTVSSVPEGASSARGYWTALMKLSTPNLTSNTFLATKTGKRVYLTRYEPPGQDGMGAKFYFPRTMEDGTPFVGIEDREIRFETQISLIETGNFSGTPGADENVRDERIWMQFDLRKMTFDGKLEI
ncbi:MAG: hypothetical protein ABIG68_01370 [Acidobacteriota bacterium]